MSSLLRISIALYFSLGLATIAHGQTRASAIRPAQLRSATPRTVVLDEDGRPVAVANPPANTAAKPAANPNSKESVTKRKIAKVLQLQFDRRPAAILNAWSTEEESKTQKEKVLTPLEQKAKDRYDEPPSPSLVINRQIDADVTRFNTDVTLSRWDSVKDFLSQLPEEDAGKVFAHLIGGLLAVTPSPEEQQNQQNGSLPIKNVILPADVLKLCELSPTEISEPDLTKLSSLLRLAVENGCALESMVESLRAGVANGDALRIGGTEPGSRRRAADLLLKTGKPKLATEFLPDLETAKKQQNDVLLNLLATHAMAIYSVDRKQEQLERVWKINQSILALAEIKTKIRNEALQRAVDLSTRVKKELGQTWMEKSFTESPEQGMRILASIGSAASQNQSTQPAATEMRLTTLRLQNTAVEALVKSAPELANRWSKTLTLLANIWLSETDLARQLSRADSTGSYMQIDMYGNYYWVNRQELMSRYNRQPFQPRAIAIGDLMEIRPSSDWLRAIDPVMITKFSVTFAQMHFRVNEEDKGFPYIEKVAEHHPELARELVHEFLRIWIKNHDPNNERKQRNPYIYFYGFDQKAEAIPLTRSKQERNLAELKGWVDRIRQMPIDDVDESLLASAFTNSHSSAEVYRIEAVEEVFGSIDTLQPETVAKICQDMRKNLGGSWQKIRTQEEKKTKRREPEVQLEVLRGYTVAQELARRALRATPRDWRLQLALSCLLHDANAYSQTVQKSSDFSANREYAFENFAKAATYYADTAATLEKADQTTEPFELWFYAGIGACDLGKVSDENVPDHSQFELIRNAITALPGELAEVHMAKFANNLFTRMSAIKPEVKFRYLKAGFKIVGDHRRAWEARSVYEYYKDLVTEIRLDVQIDGSDNVGHQQPFGLMVNLLHTTEIERESGGFAKYVQNQNDQRYSYNYGRPTEDYRDKFEESASKILGDHFEVLSITFEDPKTIRSRASENLSGYNFAEKDGISGWRVTPYAYILVKPLGPEVDKVPPLKLDMDFLDTSGYAVLPVESPAIPIVASSEIGDSRPYEQLEIVQTLDERQAKEGKLILEVKATSRGLVPPLEEIVELRNDDFEVVSEDVQPVMPNRFDSESDEVLIVSDRSWTIEFSAKTNSESPKAFKFCDVKINDAKSTFQRYDDADLVQVSNVVELERNYANRSYSWLIWLASGLIALCLFGLAGLVWMVSRPKKKDNRFEIPSELNPFTVLGLLKRIRTEEAIRENDQGQLDESINRLEDYYFGQPNGHTAPDLRDVAATWVRKAR